MSTAIEQPTPREALRAAIGAYDLAVARVGAAAAAAERAAALASSADLKLGEHDDLDGKIAAHHAGQIEAEVSPQLSPELEKARQARQTARDELAAMTGALGALMEKLAAARQAEAKALVARDAAVAGVMADEALTSVYELNRLEQQAETLLKELLEFTGIWPVTQLSFIPGAVSSALPRWRSFLELWQHPARAPRKFLDYRVALRTNSEATLVP